MSSPLDSPFTPTKILLPLDFSSSSQAAIEAATGFATKFHAQLYLVHVIPEAPDFNGSDFFQETSVLQERRSEIEQKLIDCQASLKQQGVDAEFSIETGNDIVDKLLHVTEREHLDMVIISTHGLSGWRPLIFGSIAEKVIKLVQCPLLLLRSAEPEAISAEPSQQIWDDTSQKTSTTADQHAPPSAGSWTPLHRSMLDVDADRASKRGGRTEERYDEDHSIFTK